MRAGLRPKELDAYVAYREHFLQFQLISLLYSELKSGRAAVADALKVAPGATLAVA